MKVLFVSSAPLEYSASSNMRNVALLSGFIKNGYKVYTLTPEPQKESALYDEKLCNIDITKKYYIPLGVVHSAATMKKRKKQKLKNKIYNFAKKFKIYDFRSNLAKKDVVIEEKFDIMISSSDPKSSHLIAESLKKKYPDIAKTWIQYWGDPFAGDINNSGIIPKFLIKKEEKRILSLADYILYVSPFTLEKQIQTYKDLKHKMLFLPIPYREKILYNNNESINTLGYFGEYHTRNRNILPLYTTIKNTNKYNLNICGNSDLELSQQDNIKIFGRLPVNEMRILEAKSDALLCICNKSGTQIPGKIYHYSATNKPIIIVLDGNEKEEMKRYFESFNRFIVCENTEESIRLVLDELNNIKCEYTPLEKLLPENVVKELIIKCNMGEVK